MEFNECHPAYFFEVAGHLTIPLFLLSIQLTDIADIRTLEFNILSEVSPAAKSTPIHSSGSQSTHLLTTQNTGRVH